MAERVRVEHIEITDTQTRIQTIEDMNRVIKFKAWIEPIQEMWDCDKMALNRIHLSVTGNGFVSHDEDGALELLPHIKPMQFTGLLDKNGKEIYEDDVLAFDVAKGRDNEPERLNQRGRVSISHGCVNFGIWSCLWCKDVRIIGNIHQNPELLNPWTTSSTTTLNLDHI